MSSIGLEHVHPLAQVKQLLALQYASRAACPSRKGATTHHWMTFTRWQDIPYRCLDQQGITTPMKIIAGTTKREWSHRTPSAFIQIRSKMGSGAMNITCATRRHDRVNSGSECPPCTWIAAGHGDRSSPKNRELTELPKTKRKRVTD